MNVILDNVIFSLQQSGGISVYWYHLLSRLLEDDTFDVSYIQEKNHEKNIFRNKIGLDRATLVHTSSVPIVGRYLNLKLPSLDKESIFHSSYYRVSNNPHHINITTLHDFTYEKFNSGLKLAVHHSQKKRAVLKSDGIICISENTKKDLLKFIPEAADKYIKVIHNGVDKIFRNLPKDHFDEEMIKFEAFSYIIYVGDRASSYKNFRNAVLASKLAKRPLVIVGGGDFTEKETVLLNQELHEKGFQHFNNIDTEQLNLLYNYAFCLLYPSIYEGFGIPPIEAQKTGCPVVAFNASSIPEVLGDSGILVKENTPEAFAAAITSLEDNALRNSIIKKGTDNVDKYSWERTFSETIAFYAEVRQKWATK